MRYYIKTASVVAVVMVVSFFIWGKLTEPKTYEDCVLKNVVKTETEQAARSVSVMCKKKFPPPNPFDQFDGDPISKN